MGAILVKVCVACGTGNCVVGEQAVLQSPLRGCSRIQGQDWPRSGTYSCLPVYLRGRCRAELFVDGQLLVEFPSGPTTQLLEQIDGIASDCEAGTVSCVAHLLDEPPVAKRSSLWLVDRECDFGASRRPLVAHRCSATVTDLAITLVIANEFDHRLSADGVLARRTGAVAPKQIVVHVVPDVAEDAYTCEWRVRVEQVQSQVD